MNDYIVTKDKEKFLKEEYKFYGEIFDSYDEFLEVIGDDAIPCKKCGVYYWLGSGKRCDCDKNKENEQTNRQHKRIF